jgi:hypothetical protein
VRICFLANFGKTVFYDGIGKALRARGHEVIWITPSGRWREHLIQTGSSEQEVLDLSRFENEWLSAAPLSHEQEQRLAALENSVDLSVNDMIAMDRALRELHPAKARRYLNMVEERVRRFLSANRPDVVLGEQTWAWEIMTGAVTRCLGSRVLCFSSVRFPGDRIAFSDWYRDEHLHPVRPAAPDDLAEAARLVDAFRARPARPAYEISNSRLPTLRPHWVEEAMALIGGAERGNPQARSLPARLKSRGAMLRNVLLQRLRPPFEPLPTRRDRPYMLVPLHVQPESTIDAYGSAHVDQVDNIAMLARVLPATHEILVKEHPSAAGDRGGEYYRRLLAIPQVRLVHPHEDTFSLMRGAWLVVSVAGTACYEAGLLGVPAATMVPLFFGDLMITPALTPKAESVQSLKGKVDAYLSLTDDERRERAVRLVAHVLRCSFPAVVSDPASFPPCLEPDNLERLADGIEAVFSTAKAPQATAA